MGFGAKTGYLWVEFFHEKKTIFSFFHMKKIISQKYELLFHISLWNQSLGDALEK